MQSRWVENCIRASVHGAEARKEVRRQSGHIGASFAQRRNRDSEHVETEIKVLTESARCNCFRKVGIGERHEACVHAKRIRAAKPLESALFDHTQKLSLHTRRQRGHFVEDNCATLRHFEAALLASDGPCESSALVAKKFGFDEFSRKAGAINFQKRRVATRAVLMNPARKLIFSSSALAGNEKSSGRLGELGGKLENTNRGGIGSDPLKAQRDRFRILRCCLARDRVVCRHRSVRYCFDAMPPLALRSGTRADAWAPGNRCARRCARAVRDRSTAGRAR